MMRHAGDAWIALAQGKVLRHESHSLSLMRDM
jgi:hypothetical protein